MPLVGNPASYRVPPQAWGATRRQLWRIFEFARVVLLGQIQHATVRYRDADVMVTAFGEFTFSSFSCYSFNAFLGDFVGFGNLMSEL